MTMQNDPKVKTKSWNIVSESCVEMMCSVNSDMDAEAEFINEAVAAFTTANARMRLCSMLDWLSPGQHAYCDTNSCIFLCDHNNPNHKSPFGDHKDLPEGLSFGNALGQWSNELR